MAAGRPGNWLSAGRAHWFSHQRDHRFNGQTLAAGTRVPFANGVDQATFLIVRTTSGVATTIPLVLEDDCGDWPTFVGAGPAA